jgi:hypothetical protein
MTGADWATVACVTGAAIIAATGHDGWDWFLFLGYLAL